MQSSVSIWNPCTCTSTINDINSKISEIRSTQSFVSNNTWNKNNKDNVTIKALDSIEMLSLHQLNELCIEYPDRTRGKTLYNPTAASLVPVLVSFHSIHWFTLFPSSYYNHASLLYIQQTLPLIPIMKTKQALNSNTSLTVNQCNWRTLSYRLGKHKDTQVTTQVQQLDPSQSLRHYTCNLYFL